MDVPLQEISGCRDGDDDPGPDVLSEVPAYVLGQRLGARLTQIEQQLPALAERGPQQTWDRQYDMPVWERLQNLPLEPLRPQQ